MEKLKVRDLMSPAADFPHISEEATFSEAVWALEKHFDEFKAGKAKQYITLVHDAQHRIVGKLSPMDVVRGLEPGYGKMLVDVSRSSFAVPYEHFTKTVQEQSLWTKPLADLCGTIRGVRVKDFLRKPTEAQVVKADYTLSEALHRFVLGRHDSLFVTEGGHLVGLLLFYDLYREIQRYLREVCKV